MDDLERAIQAVRELLANPVIQKDYEVQRQLYRIGMLLCEKGKEGQELGWLVEDHPNIEIIHGIPFGKWPDEREKNENGK